MSTGLPAESAGRAPLQRVVLRAGVVFLIVLVVLTFLSRTILNLTLPRVTAEVPSSGPLVRSVYAEGTVTATRTQEVYVDGRRRVLDLRVHVGDTVREGQLLAVLASADRQTAVTRLAAAWTRAGDEQDRLLAGAASAELTTIDSALAVARAEVQALTTRLSRLKDLQARGGETAEAVNSASMELMRAAQALTEQEQARDQRQEAILAEIRSCLPIAPADGVVSAVNAASGGFTDGGLPLAVVLPRTAGLQVKLSVAARQAAALAVGDTVTLTPLSGEAAAVDSRIVRIALVPGSGSASREVTISVPTESTLEAGDIVKAAATKTSRPYKILVPTSAMGKEQRGEFAWALRRQSALLGDEYYAVQVFVNSIDNDDFSSALAGGVEPDTLIVTHSSKPLTQGARVVLE